MIDVSCIPLVTGTQPGPMKIFKIMWTSSYFIKNACCNKIVDGTIFLSHSEKLFEVSLYQRYWSLTCYCARRMS